MKALNHEPKLTWKCMNMKRCR